MPSLLASAGMECIPNVVEHIPNAMEHIPNAMEHIPNVSDRIDQYYTVVLTPLTAACSSSSIGMTRHF